MLKPLIPLYRAGEVGRKVLLRLAAYPIGINLNHGFCRTSILDFTCVNRQPNQSPCFTRHWTPLIIVCRILLMMDVSVLRPIGGLYLPPDKLAWQYRCSCMLRTDKGPRSSLTLWSDQVSLLPIGPALLPFAHVPRPASILAPKMDRKRKWGRPKRSSTCTGNGNDGATSGNLTGNRTEGAPAHVFHNFARFPAKSAAYTPPDRK